MGGISDRLFLIGLKRNTELNGLSIGFEERAGILEHDGGWPKVKAEALALAEMQTYQKRRNEAAA